MLRSILVSSVVTLSSIAAVTPSQARTWVDSTGEFRVEADYLRADTNFVWITDAKGTLKISRDKLSDADQRYVRDQELLGARSTRERTAERPVELAQRPTADRYGAPAPSDAPRGSSPVADPLPALKAPVDRAPLELTPPSKASEGAAADLLPPRYDPLEEVRPTTPRVPVDSTYRSAPPLGVRGSEPAKELDNSGSLDIAPVPLRDPSPEPTFRGEDPRNILRGPSSDRAGELLDRSPVGSTGEGAGPSLSPLPSREPIGGVDREAPRLERNDSLDSSSDLEPPTASEPGPKKTVDDETVPPRGGWRPYGDPQPSSEPPRNAEPASNSKKVYRGAGVTFLRDGNQGMIEFTLEGEQYLENAQKINGPNAAFFEYFESAAGPSAANRWAFSKAPSSSVGGPTIWSFDGSKWNYRGTTQSTDAN